MKAAFLPVHWADLQGHVWTYMDPALCGLSDHRREPRWIFARFPLNGAKALAEAMPVQTPGSGSDGVTVSPSSANRCNC